MLNALLTAIVDDDRSTVVAMLEDAPSLASRTIMQPRLYEVGIFHWMYVGDTALHLAAAGYRTEIVSALLAAGANPNWYMNHRRSGPIHYAADGYIIGPAWNPEAQVRTLRRLLDAGCNVDAQDANGATPLHRAVRTRCDPAVKFLLSVGADTLLRNKPGSTAFHLAVQNTGRGGSGDTRAKDAQRHIIELFLSHGVSPALKDGKGHTVLDCAKTSWVREMLSTHPV